MRSRWLLLVIAITVGSMAGCHRAAPPAPPALQASSLPPIQVRAKANMLFTFVDSGAFRTVSEFDKVPAGSRDWVRVVDLGVRPEQRRDQELVYVAKLTEPRADGTYAYVVMSRSAFEELAMNRSRSGGAAAPASQPGAAGGGARVILYATSWCPACRAARQYLTEQQIPFVEKDIEKDGKAADELLEKARSQGISASGVPVLDVNGTLMQGFDAERLNHLLGG